VRLVAGALVGALALGGCGARPGRDTTRPVHDPPIAAPASAAAPPVDARLEQVLGSLGDVVFREKHDPYLDDALAAYVGRVLDRLSPHAGRPELRFHVQVIDSPEANAWSVPGGYLFVGRGALALAESEAELAAVIAHELAHTASRHALYEFWRAAMKQEDAPGSPFPEAAYDRDMEFQADRLGLGYLRAAGYDARVMPRILGALLLSANAEGKTDEAMIPRLARLSRHLGDATGGEVGRDAYLDHVDGLVYGPDPRRGVLRDRTYLCARCGLAFDLPPGWKTEQVVPHVEARDAQGLASMSFRSVPTKARADLRTLLAPSTVRDEAMAGFALTVGAPAQQSEREAMAIVVDADQTYTLTASGPRPEQLLRAILGTLRRVRGADAEVRPTRIRVRRFDEGGRFADLVPRCGGSTAPIAELARINGVEPTDPIAAGSRLKCLGW
jgi:predicted Zn-dependent protease